MINPPPEASPISWLTDLDQAARLASGEHGNETTSVLGAVEQALVEDDRPEILARSDRAIELLARDKRWRIGMQLAHHLYAVVQTWSEFDASAYAKTLAQFTFNYALEFKQAHVLGPAEDLLRQALHLFEEGAEPRGAVACEHQLGCVLQERGELWRAQQAYFSSLQRARRLNDARLVCRNLFQLGQLAQLKGDLAASVDWYSQTLALAEEMSDERVATARCHQLGMIEQMRGHYLAATDRFHDAFARAEKMNDARGAAIALHQLGMLAQAQGELSRADELYRASLTFAAQLPDPAEQAPTLYQLAQCAWIRGEFATARDYGYRSLGLVQAQGNLEGIDRVRRLLSSIPSRSLAGGGATSILATGGDKISPSRSPS